MKSMKYNLKTAGNFWCRHVTFNFTGEVHEVVCLIQEAFENWWRRFSDEKNPIKVPVVARVIPF